MRSRSQVLEVWGEFACFSRPEMKVERFSYPLITPSAARGIFDAIYCKPKEFRWQVTQIEVLPWRSEREKEDWPSYIALRRNEVKEKVSVRAVADWARGKEIEPILADVDRDYWGTDERGRTQRQTMALNGVRYRLRAEIRPWPDFADKQQAFEAQFRRRAAHGKCVYQPYMGCREFPAYFVLIENESATAPPLQVDVDIGLMLYDVFDLSCPGSPEDSACISLFNAEVRAGVLQVPDYNSDHVLKSTRRTAC